MAEANQRSESKCLRAENLLYHIESVAACIESNEDFQSFAYSLRELRLIPFILREELDLMHESVPLSTKCRYLLWSVYNTVQNISSGIETFLTLLSKLPVGRKLACDYYKKQHWYGSIAVIIWDYSKIIWDYSEDEICKMLKEMFRQTDKGDHSNTSIIQPQPIYVNERDEPFTILLDVKIAAPHLEDKTCRWTKNNDTVSNSVCPLLCVHIADVTAEGTYKFYVGLNKNAQTIFTIYINCSVEKYSSVCVQQYKDNDLAKADEDAWPQVSQNTYINLAVIETQAEQKLNTYICETIRGDADDIHRAKGEINYKDAFEDIKHGEVVLVEGRPGSGKTTLVHKISKDWANIVSQNALNHPEQQCIMWRHIKILFLISLRTFCGNPYIKLVDLVKCYYSNKKTIEIICDYITLKEGAGICFILDGLDEYQPNNRGNFIFKLIEKKVLPKSIIIVASRPAAVAKYRSAKKHIEVLGFFKEQIFEYIDSYNFSDDSLNSNCMLKQYLKERPNVYHMCYLPIQLAMVCFLYDKMKGTLPETETAIYEEFTKHTILRSLYRMHEHSECYVKSIFTLPEQESVIFCNICTLAFDKTLSSKQVLEQSDVDLVCEEVNASFGLLTTDRASTKCGFQKLYTFCHLTLQEFLAACHIFMAKQEHQLKLVEISKKKKHMTVVLKFFCGLVDFGQDGYLFRDLINADPFNCLTKIQCAFESQQTITCNFVADNGSLSIEETFLSARDWAAIGFVLSNADHHDVRKLFLDTSSISKEGLDALKQTNKSCGCLKVESICVSGEVNVLLLNFIRMLPTLHILSTQIHISTYNMFDFLKKIQHSSLKVWHLHEYKKPKLIVKVDFFDSVKNFLISSFKTLNASSCCSSLVDIILKCIEVQSDFFIKELTKMCSALCSSESFVKMSLSDIDSNQATMVAESFSISNVKYKTANIADRFLSENRKPDSLLYFCNFIPVGNVIVGFCYEITRPATNYYTLWILPRNEGTAVENSHIINKRVLQVVNAYMNNVQSIKTLLLQSQLISHFNRKVDTIVIYDVDLQNSALRGSVSQFQLTSNARNLSAHYKMKCDLTFLRDVILSFTNLHLIATFKHCSIIISKILESFNFCDTLTQDSYQDTDNCQAEDYIEVERMTVSGSNTKLNYDITCTSAFLKLNFSLEKSLSALIYFNCNNLNVIQFEIDKKLKLILKFDFKSIQSLFLYSLQSLNKVNSTTFASILSYLVVNCLDAKIDHSIDELAKLCSQMCMSSSGIRLSMVQKCVSDQIYMICESLDRKDVAKEINPFSTTQLCYENFNSTLLHYTDFIQIEDYIIALLVDVTDSATNFNIYIFPKDSISHIKYDTNILRLDSSFISEVQKVLPLSSQDSYIPGEQRHLLSLSVSNHSNLAYPIENMVSHTPYSLTHLKFDGSTIVKEDIHALCQALSSSTNVISFSVTGDCKNVLSDWLASLRFEVLSQICLEGCNITSELFEKLSPILCHFNLFQFYLTNNIMDSISMVKSLAEVLAGWKNLQTLCLSHCQLTSSFLSILTEGIKECYLLHTLDLSHNKFGSNGCTHLFDTICCLKTSDNFRLCNINLSYCDIGDDGIPSLANLIRQISTYLLVFDISGNNFSSKGADKLAVALQSCSNLIELGFDMPMLQNVSILVDTYNLSLNYLMGVLAATLKLRKLSLSYLLMNCIQIKDFAELVQMQKHLETFKLSNCSIKVNRHDDFLWQGNFKSLDFSHNVYNSQGFYNLCKSIRFFKCLRYLNLSGSSNMLNSDEPLEFEILDLPTSIEVIYLDNTNLSVGIYHIAEVISKCDKLRVLSMSNCNIGNSGAAKIANELKESFHLRKLDLQHNFISKAVISSISAILSECPSLIILA